MQGTLGPDVALAALAVRRSHPRKSALEVLEVCLRRRVGRVSDLGGAMTVGSPFAMIVAEAFDKPGRDWSVVNRSDADPTEVAALRRLWRVDILPKFAKHFDFTL